MKWEDPPTGYRGRPRSEVWAREAAELRSHPGTWAKIAEDMTSDKAGHLANNIRAGKLKNFSPRGDFEATSRNGAVYARFVDHA